MIDLPQDGKGFTVCIPIVYNDGEREYQSYSSMRSPYSIPLTLGCRYKFECDECTQFSGCSVFTLRHTDIYELVGQVNDHYAERHRSRIKSANKT
jgi:hypothetical protein